MSEMGLDRAGNKIAKNLIPIDNKLFDDLSKLMGDQLYDQIKNIDFDWVNEKIDRGVKPYIEYDMTKNRSLMQRILNFFGFGQAQRETKNVIGDMVPIKSAKIYFVKDNPKIPFPVHGGSTFRFHVVGNPTKIIGTTLEIEIKTNKAMLLGGGKQDFINDLRVTLAHELTHMAQVAKNPWEVGLPDVDKNPDMYFNAPNEVQAYARQIVQGIADEFRDNPNLIPLSSREISALIVKYFIHYHKLNDN
jgi:hypothetical protein